MKGQDLDALLYRLRCLRCPKVLALTLGIYIYIWQLDAIGIIKLMPICVYQTAFLRNISAFGFAHVFEHDAEIMASIILLTMWTSSLDMKEDRDVNLAHGLCVYFISL